MSLTPARLGEHLRAIRHDRSLSQEALATRAGLAVDTIRRIERGAMSPSLETLVKLATGLRLGLGTLLSGAETQEVDAREHAADLMASIPAARRAHAERVIRAIIETTPVERKTRG